MRWSESNVVEFPSRALREPMSHTDLNVNTFVYVLSKYNVKIYIKSLSFDKKKFFYVGEWISVFSASRTGRHTYIQYESTKEQKKSKCGIYIFAPPPSWFIFLPQRKFITMRWCALQAKNFKPFLFNYLNFKLIGENYAFPTFFSSPFNHFFPQHDIWPYFCHIFGGSTEKYTPLLQPCWSVCVERW